MAKKKKGINSLRLKRDLESQQLEGELTELEKQKTQLKSKLDTHKKFQKKYFKNWNKLKKWFIFLIIFSILIILISLICIIFNINEKIQIAKVILHLSTNLWNNLFFLGLTIFTISFIFFQLKQSILHQMQVNLFWKEWEEFEKLSKEIFNLKHKIVKVKANKHLVDLPTMYLNNTAYIQADSLDPKKFKDPELKSLFKKINEEIKKNPKNFRIKKTKELIKKGGVFSP